ATARRVERAHAARHRELATQPERSVAESRGFRPARRGVTALRLLSLERRGLRARRLRRRPARDGARATRAQGALLRGVLVRQDLPRHRLEARLLRCAAGVDGGAAARAPVRHFRVHVTALLANTKFRLRRAAGTYFQLADYGAISTLPDVEFARWLTIEHGVATIPISVFYRDPPPMRLVRFCFAKENATLDAAAERLRRL